MKKLLTVILVLSIASVACEAFKNNYDSQGAETAPVVASDNQLPGGVVGAPGGSIVADFSADTTVCEAVKDVTVGLAEETGVVTETAVNMGKEGAKLTTKAEKVGVFTTKITILSDDKDLISFTLKQTAEKEFAVCSVVYGEMTVSSGKITIDQFNNGKADDLPNIVNAGTFSFAFSSKDGAVVAATAIKALAGADVAAEALFEGSYFVKGLAELEVKK